MNRKARSYCFTVNNYTDDTIADLIIFCDLCDYMIVGFERGEEGTPHIQGYVHFVNPISFNTVKKHVYCAHIERSKGNAQQNQAYCSKEGCYYEYGNLPVQGRAKWDTIVDAMANPKDNPSVYRQYQRYYKDIVNLSKKDFKTSFYQFKETADSNDPITACYEYFNWDDTDQVAVVTELSQLEAYDYYEHVIYYCMYPDQVVYLWPRGVPISYKYGYECKKIHCHTFIIITSQNMPLYKNI